MQNHVNLELTSIIKRMKALPYGDYNTFSIFYSERMASSESKRFCPDYYSFSLKREIAGKWDFFGFFDMEKGKKPFRISEFIYYQGGEFESYIQDDFLKTEFLLHLRQLNRHISRLEKSFTEGKPYTRK